MTPHIDQQGLASGVSRANLLLSLISHDELYNDIDDYPEGDVRLRFQKLRTFRAQYVDGKVKERERELASFIEGVRNGNRNAEDGAVKKEFDELMVELDKYLDWSSRALEQDSKAAEAPVVDSYFMDNVFRHHLESPKSGSRAPNGEPKSFYGSRGDTVSPYLTTPRGCDDNLFRRLVVGKLMLPFHGHIYIPCRRLYNNLTNGSSGLEDYEVEGRTLRVIVSALECMLSVACVSGSVILLHNLNSMRDRLIAATFMSLAFPYAVIFLTEEALRMFTLTAAYWAVMVVFIATSTYSSKDN